MSDISSADRVRALLQALGRHLARDQMPADLVIIGGSALLALELTARATRDIDVVAVVNDDHLESAAELPQPLLDACRRVARDFDVPPDWLNSEPADLLRFGLPTGLPERWTTESFGPALTVRWVSRLDQIHFKLYAAVDQAGKHLADLQALAPTADELIDAARWTRTHDPSEGFLSALREALAYFGVPDVDLGV